MSAGKRKPSEREDKSHQAFIQLAKALRASRQERVNVAILLNRPDGTQDRFWFNIRKVNLHLLDAAGDYIDRLASLVAEENINILERDMDGDGNCYRGLAGTGRSYKQVSNEIVYVWFAD